MKPALPTLYTAAAVLALCVWLWGCGPWELPPLKSERTCARPKGSILIEPNQLQIKASLKDVTGEVDSILWRFGDGSVQMSAAQATVSRTYASPDTYTVTATLMNACMDKEVITQQIRVTNVVKPSVVTLEDPEVQYTTARVRLQLVSTGNTTITRYGICWSATSVSPSIENGDSTTDGTVPNPPLNTPITVQIPRLQANTPYRFRAFAINSGGVGYGLTLDPPRRTNRYPDFTITSVGCGADCFTTARVNWRINDFGQPQPTQYGVTYSPINKLPEIATASFVEATGPNAPIDLTGLLPGQEYNLRLYTRTAGGVYYAPGPAVTYRTPSTLRRDLVLDLPFFDAQYNAPSLNDMSNNGNDATQKNGAPVYGQDRNGLAQRALRLQGRANEYIYVADDPALRPDVPLTMSLWFQISAPADTMTLWSKSRFADGAGDQYNCLLIRPGSAAERAISVSVKPGANCPRGESGRTVSAVFSLGANGLRLWNHLAVIYRDGSVSVYLNGSELPASALKVYQPNGRQANDCLYGELKFGSCNGKTPYYFNGWLDDIRLHRRELTAAEVQELAGQ